MSEHIDEPQDWPLREWSTRLRPPGPPAEPPEEPEEPARPDAPVEEQPPAPAQIGEPEILYEDDPEEPEGLELELELEEPEQYRAPKLEQLEPALAPPEPVVVEEADEDGEHAGGEFRVPGGYAVLEGAPTGRRRSVAIVVSRFNGEITNRLLASALAELGEAGVAEDAVLIMPVPGAFELPIAAMALAKTRRYSCVVALGCVIRGETPHFDFVATEAASGLQLAGIETGVPVAFGVLTCDTVEQAEARIDRGATAARSALEMADAFSQLRAAAAARQ
jgi:6,7-dimethyl-8-ribityllumazine synthase